MRPEHDSQTLLAITRSKGKMYEYGVPAEHHIDIPRDPSHLFPLTIGLLGDLASQVNTADGSSSQTAISPSNLRFASYFLDAYRETRLARTLDPYLLLLGSASYYLCGLPGSSKVLADHLAEDLPDFGGAGLEKLLLWLLRGDFSTPLVDPGGTFGKSISLITGDVVAYYQGERDAASLFAYVQELRGTAYHNGTSRQLLLADICGAVVRRRRDNSARYCLPQYSGLSLATWS